MAVEEVAGGLSTGAAIALAAGLSMGLSALAGSWSQGSFGSALMGAIAERPEIEKNVLVWLVLPEIFAVLGFVIAFLLVGKLE